MNVDLRTCKPGDKLLTVHGNILTYVGPNEHGGDLYPHLIRYPHGGFGSRTDDGHVYINDRRTEDEDIIEILTPDEEEK
jgi:hypothetical protein